MFFTEPDTKQGRFVVATGTRGEGGEEMANWAHNTLTITGAEAAVRAFVEADSKLMKLADASRTISTTEYGDTLEAFRDIAVRKSR
jgi:mono/diheme cytochrome c family protein